VGQVPRWPPKPEIVRSSRTEDTYNIFDFKFKILDLQNYGSKKVIYN